MKEQMKRYLGMKGWAMFLTGVFMLSSCAEDEVFEKYAPNADGESISFNISKANPTWEPDSRAAVECGRQNFVLRSEESDDTLCVSARTEYGFPDVQSRGALVSSKNDVTSFEVFSNFYTQSQPDVSSFYFMKNEKVENGAPTSKTYYWPPAECNLDFIALAPYKAGRTWTSEDADGNPIAPRLTYTVDDDVTKHEDLMLAKTDKMNLGNTTTSVPLSFNHILASVQFAFDNMPEGTVKSISISGLLSKTGTYTVGGNWSNSSEESVTYTIAADAGVATTQDANGKKIVNEKIITLPQSFAAEKLTLTVVFNDNSAGERTLTAKIPAGSWAQGTTTTYTISITPAYTLEFLEYTETLDAHYIITTIKFRTDTDWTMSVLNGKNDATGIAYLSKNKTNTGTQAENKENEITSNQLLGMWSYVKKCNKPSISGEVAKEGTTEEITVYMLVRENATSTERNINIQLNKTGVETNPRIQTFKQLGYKVYDGFAMERIEDATSHYGFALNLGTVTYNYTANGFFSWIISALATASGNSLITWGLDVLDGPDPITINLTSNVEGITSETSGLNNTKKVSTVSLSQNLNGLIQAGWYTISEADKNKIDEEEIKLASSVNAFSYCLQKNSYGDFTNGDDSNVELTENKLLWYLPAIGEMEKIINQDSSPASEYSNGAASDNPPTRYWSSTAIQGTTVLNSYSWGFGDTQRVPTSRATTLKVRCARKTN